MLPRYIQYSGTYNGTNEVDMIGLSGLDIQGGSTASFWSGSASKTITAGPVSVGPVLMEVNGVVFALPFNVACTAPLEVWNSLNPQTVTGSQTVATASIWTFA